MARPIAETPILKDEDAVRFEKPRRKMKLVKLTPDTELAGFDCGDEDLNNFLVEDAKGFLDKRIVTSYILEEDGNIVAYYLI